jgi:hypothetical protein
MEFVLVYSQVLAQPALLVFGALAGARFLRETFDGRAKARLKPAAG